MGLKYSWRITKCCNKLRLSQSTTEGLGLLWGLLDSWVSHSKDESRGGEVGVGWAAEEASVCSEKGVPC